MAPEAHTADEEHVSKNTMKPKSDGYLKENVG